MRYAYCAKKDLPNFILQIMGMAKVAAPVKKENQYVFSVIDDPSQVCVDYLPTILPPKKYFFPQRERLGSFKTKDTSFTSSRIMMDPLIILGVHTCDIEGIECMDVVFNAAPTDPYFLKRKKEITIIGFECLKACDNNATCSTMDTNNPKAGYDIMITEDGDRYIFHINSEQGDKLVSRDGLFKEAGPEAKERLREIRREKQKDFPKRLEAGYNDLYKVFKKSYGSETWEDVGKRCLSCGNCTAVCPTCYCFDIFDELSNDLTEGVRSRVWDSCQLEEFAEVAGGENFREERSSRQRHRYFRKFEYPVKKHNKFFCTGCGRCTRTCMAKISLVETVNSLTKEAANV